MRAYLSSFRVGDQPERLLSLLKTDRPVAVIANAMDDAPGDLRLAGVEREHVSLRALGLQTEEVDLREYFASHDGLAAELSRFEMAWLRGGNVFMLRYALARSGADQLLTGLLQRDELVYAGYSAGPCVLAPSLRGLELCDHPESVREVHGAPPI
jgi:dipeptidase E